MAVSVSRCHALSALALAPLALPIVIPSAIAQDAQSLAAASVIEEIKKRDALIVGVATFVPWAMRDRKGKLIGVEIDVARRLSQDMGVKLELVPTAFDGMVPSLLGRKFGDVHGTGRAEGAEAPVRRRCLGAATDRL